MKALLTLIGMIFHISMSLSQNLINNSSFEEHSSCPINSQEFWKVSGWYGPDVEYYHSCSPFLSKSTPKNSFGFQIPKSGMGYGGFLVYLLMPNMTFPELYSGMEIAGSRLNQELDKKRYCGGYYVSRCNGSPGVTDAFQMYLTKDSLYYDPQTWYDRPFPAQITNKNGVLTDTVNWMNIEGSFVANGDEKFVNLGVFLDSAHIQFYTLPFDSMVGPPFGVLNVAYYYFDDAYLYELNKLPQAQNHAYNCSANTVTLKTDTGFNFRWYYLPDTVNVLSTTDTFMVDASQERTVLLRATLCSTEFADTVTVPKLDCTGLEGNALAQGANLFPNPASTHVTLQLGGTPPPGSRLRLLDLHGRELRSTAVLSPTTDIPLHALPAGVYIAELVVNGQGIWRRKLCKFEE